MNKAVLMCSHCSAMLVGKPGDLFRYCSRCGSQFDYTAPERVSFKYECRRCGTKVNMPDNVVDKNYMRCCQTCGEKISE